MGTGSSMSPLNAHLHRLPANARQRRYLELAHAALAHYALHDPHPVFLQHNSGITYRIEMPRTGDCFLLKIHAPVGLGTPPPAVDDIEVRLQWLVDVSQLIYGALGNLAFQVTIPEQWSTALLARNLRQLVDAFCRSFLAETPIVDV